MKNSKLNLYISITNILCLIIIARSLITALVMWNNIPNQIPIHFNIAGQIDKYGDKVNIIVVLCVGLALYILVSLIGLILKIPNIGIKEKEHQILSSMLATIKFILAILFVIVAVFMMISMPIPSWFINLEPLLNISSIVFFLIFLFIKTKKKK